MKKKNFSPEDFLTRAEKIKKLELPQNDNQRVIIPCNKEGVGFRFNCYKPEFLLQHVSKQTFDQTVQGVYFKLYYKAHKICGNVWKMRKIQETNDSQEGSADYLIGALVLSLISLVMLIIVVYWNQNMYLLYTAISIIFFTGCKFYNHIKVITIYVAFKTLFVSLNFIELETETIKRLTQFFALENQDYYLKKGLRWEIQPNFYWLELHINIIK